MSALPEPDASGKLAHVSFPIFLAVSALVLWCALRALLWLEVGPENLTVAESWRSFVLGAWFDVWTLAYLIAPLLLAAGLLSNHFRVSRIAHGLRWFMVWAVIAALLFDLVAEYLFWQEFTTRFNFIAVDYLIYTHEVIGNIRESYPVPLIFAAIGLLAALILYVSRRYLRFTDTPYTWRHRAALIPLAMLLPLLSSMVANLDQADSNSAYAQELGANGLFNLAAAMRRNTLDYDRFYRTISPMEAASTLRELGVKRTSAMRFVHTAANSEKASLGPFSKRPKNVVLITVESLSARYLGAYGSRDGLTPNLDRLAAAGLQFERAFATGTRTVRGLEALSLGTPPIPGQAIVRRPNNDHLGTVGEYLEAQGYITEFIYGGYSYFDNMSAYFSGNDFKVTDRTNFDSRTIATENIWGVADESLFDNALLSLDRSAKSSRPFFVQIMTTSNHRPYTFPEGRIDLPQGKRSGAVKYTDYAIGRFVEQAKSRPWFNDTLFVIVADHCASVAGKTKLPVDKYHIPLIFYAPALLKPGKYEPVVSQIDVPPTLLDLLGVAGSDHFFGQSLFVDHNVTPRAFISNYQSLGYYKGDQLLVLSPRQAVQAFRIDPVSYEATETQVNTRLAREAIAYYQTASNAYKNGSLKELPVIAANRLAQTNWQVN